MKFNKSIPELAVVNLEESIKFYETCGFKVEYERKEDSFIFLSLGEIQFMLQEIKGNDKWEVGLLEYPFGRGVNFELEVGNVDEIYKKIREAGYEIRFPMEENWYREGNRLLGCKEFLVQDPDGYLLRFQEDLGSKKDE